MEKRSSVGLHEAAKTNFGLEWCGNRRQKPKERIDIQGGLNQPASDRRQKAIFPRRGGIAFSANERIDGFLEFAIRAKFAYVNKRRGGLNQPASDRRQKAILPRRGENSPFRK